ncbi:MAG: GNAT family N-acetyltransferase [Oscillospiraceae bacterium]|nr:GNAT family N-acetyltransferase [Oscillospiraceae bacterium]MCR4760853.1 GNAT family N-acetyltransferase [Oscillospiraceae bacterium]
MIRELQAQDFESLLQLYTHLHEKSVPESSPRRDALRDRILSDPDYHIIVAEEDGRIVSSCVCVIVPNLTHDLRPYALIENVVTHADYRGRGLATACLDYAKQIALRENCYKMMLMTGSKLESTLRFYERAGYSSADKTAFNQWL